MAEFEHRVTVTAGEDALTPAMLGAAGGGTLQPGESRVFSDLTDSELAGWRARASGLPGEATTLFERRKEPAWSQAGVVMSRDNPPRRARTERTSRGRRRVG